MSIWQNLRAIFQRRSPQMPRLIIHDPEASKPHDLDDPFFDRGVQARIGVEIANAAEKKPAQASTSQHAKKP